MDIPLNMIRNATDAYTFAPRSEEVSLPAEVRSVLSSLDPRNAGALAGMVGYRVGEVVSFEHVVQQLFSLYAKLRGISGLAAIRIAFDQFNASAQSALEQLRSTQLSSGLTIAFSAFGVGLGAGYLSKSLYGSLKGKFSLGATNAPGGKQTHAVGSSRNLDGDNGLPRTGEVVQNDSPTLQKSSFSSAKVSRRDSLLDERHSTSSTYTSVSGKGATQVSQPPRADVGQVRGVASGDQANNSRQTSSTAVATSEKTHESMSQVELMQIINGVIMYLFPSLGQAVGSLAGAPNQHASDLFKAISEQFAAMRSSADKSEDASQQGMSSIAQAYSQSPN